jgi:peptidylprolyl isomerase
MSVRLTLLAVAAVSLSAAACGSDADDTTPVDTAEAVLALVEDAGFDPTAAPPTELTVIDVRVGDGAEATAGDRLNMQYSGVSWSNGQLFDSSWQRGMPFTFQLGQEQVITGWDDGVPGMREGGQRLLILPPEFAYGAIGSGPIGPNETLIFVVDLLDVN